MLKISQPLGCPSESCWLLAATNRGFAAAASDFPQSISRAKASSIYTKAAN